MGSTLPHRAADLGCSEGVTRNFEHSRPKNAAPPLVLIHINYTAVFSEMQYVFYPFSIEFLSFPLFFCNVITNFKITCIMSTRNVPLFVPSPVGFCTRFWCLWKRAAGFHLCHCEGAAVGDEGALRMRALRLPVGAKRPAAPLVIARSGATWQSVLLCHILKRKPVQRAMDCHVGLCPPRNDKLGDACGGARCPH